ncbi:MAG: HNH endonuclease, partial [Candidatus Dormibacteria bacterium]
HSYSAGQILYVHCRCEDCQGLRFWAFRCAARTAKLRGGQRRRDSLRAARRAPVDLEFIYVRDRGTCGLCGERVADADLSLDHVIPISKGGLHQPDNVQLAHRSCNSRKYDRDLSRAGRWPFGLTPPEHWRIPDD